MRVEELYKSLYYYRVIVLWALKIIPGVSSKLTQIAKQNTQDKEGFPFEMVQAGSLA